MKARRFLSGERIPASGVYAVDHAHHRLPREVTLLAEYEFPGCHCCDEPVEFTILHLAPDWLRAGKSAIVLYQLPELAPDTEPEAA